MPDLDEFPDGGRATKARRFIPTLTRRQFEMLALSPYESPGRWTNRSMVGTLVRAGLLERDPSAPNWCRVTKLGADVVARWRAAGWGDPR